MAPISSLSGLSGLSGLIPPVAAGAATTPDAVANLTGWWRADTTTLQTAGGTPATADGDPVGEWRDKALLSSGGYMAVATSTQRPTLKTGIFGTQPAVRFDGTDDNLHQTTLGVSQFITASDYCCYAVFRVISASANFVTSYNNGAIFADSGAYIGLHPRAATGDLYHYNWDGNEDFSTGAWVANTAYAVELIHTGGNLSMLRSGTSVVSVASGNTQAIGGALRFGLNGGTSYLNCDIGDLFFYNVVPSSSNRSALRQYITNRYGITW